MNAGNLELLVDDVAIALDDSAVQNVAVVVKMVHAQGRYKLGAIVLLSVGHCFVGKNSGQVKLARIISFSGISWCKLY